MGIFFFLVFKKEDQTRNDAQDVQPEQLKQAGNKAFAAGNTQAALGARSFALERPEQEEKARADGEGKRECGGRREQGRGG